MAARSFPSLFRRLKLAFHTQYAQVCRRGRGEGELLPGTPGALMFRTGTGYGHWYRRYNSLPSQEAEDLVCKDGGDEGTDAGWWTLHCGQLPAPGAIRAAQGLLEHQAPR